MVEAKNVEKGGREASQEAMAVRQMRSAGWH